MLTMGIVMPSSLSEGHFFFLSFDSVFLDDSSDRDHLGHSFFFASLSDSRPTSASPMS